MSDEQSHPDAHGNPVQKSAQSLHGNSCLLSIEAVYPVSKNLDSLFEAANRIPLSDLTKYSDSRIGPFQAIEAISMSLVHENICIASKPFEFLKKDMSSIKLEPTVDLPGFIEVGTPDQVLWFTFLELVRLIRGMYKSMHDSSKYCMQLSYPKSELDKIVAGRLIFIDTIQSKLIELCSLGMEDDVDRIIEEYDYVMMRLSPPQHFHLKGYTLKMLHGEHARSLYIPLFSQSSKQMSELLGDVLSFDTENVVNAHEIVRDAVESEVYGFLSEQTRDGLFDLPPVGMMLLKHATKHNLSIIDAAHQMRDSDEAIEYRKWLGLIQEVLMSGDRSMVLAIGKELNMLKEVAKEWGRRSESDYEVKYRDRTFEMKSCPRLSEMLEAVSLSKIKFGDKIITGAPRYLEFISKWYKD